MTCPLRLTMDEPRTSAALRQAQREEVSADLAKLAANADLVLSLSKDGGPYQPPDCPRGEV
jgi:hypothetical protein